MPALTLTDPEFAALRVFINKRSGILVGDSKRYLIESRLSALAREIGCESFYELHAKLAEAPTSPLADQVVDAMTTNETHWFRDVGPWQILRGELLPRYCEEIQAGRRSRVRIWSAAASTGQEPYSIAISILEHLRDAPGVKRDAFQIVATDLSPSASFVASAGRYNQAAIERGLAPELRERYFVASESCWTVVPEVKDLVRVARRNLLDPFTDLGTFDLVFCRNVLIYFSSELKRDIVQRISERIGRDGGVVVGASESLMSESEHLSMKPTCGSFLYEPVAREGRRE